MQEECGFPTKKHPNSPEVRWKRLFFFFKCKRVAGGGVWSEEQAPRTWTTSPLLPPGARLQATSRCSPASSQAQGRRAPRTSLVGAENRRAEVASAPEEMANRKCPYCNAPTVQVPTHPASYPWGLQSEERQGAGPGSATPHPGPRARSSRGSRAASPGHSSAGPSHPARGRTRTPHRARPAPIGARAATWRGFPGCLEQLPGSRFQPSAPQPSSGLAHCGLGRTTPPPDGHYLGRNSQLLTGP